MAVYRRVYDSCHLQADCQEPGSAPKPYARQSSMGQLYLFTSKCLGIVHTHTLHAAAIVEHQKRLTSAAHQRAAKQRMCEP